MRRARHARELKAAQRAVDKVSTVFWGTSYPFLALLAAWDEFVLIATGSLHELLVPPPDAPKGWFANYLYRQADDRVRATTRRWWLRGDDAIP